MLKPWSVLTPKNPRVGSVARDEAEVAEQQQEDPAEIAHRPAESGDAADVRRGGDLPQHGVVEDGADLEEDRAEADQGGAEEEVVVVVPHQEQPDDARGPPAPEKIASDRRRWPAASAC